MRPSLTLAVMLALASIAVAAPPKHAERSRIQPVVHEGDEFTVVHFPRAGAGEYVHLYSLNDRGQAAGTVIYHDDGRRVERAVFLDTDRVLYELPFGPNGRGNCAVFVTDKGVPVGAALLWSHDRIIETRGGSDVFLRSLEDGVGLTTSPHFGYALARVRPDGACETFRPEIRRMTSSRQSTKDAVDAQLMMPPGRSGQGFLNRAGAMVGNLDIKLKDGRSIRRAAVAQVAKSGMTADVVELGTLGGFQSTAAAINARGEVVGEAEGESGYRPFIARRRGPNYAISELPLPAGMDRGAALSMNDAGVVVGAGWKDGTPRAFIHERGQSRPTADLLSGTGFNEPLIVARHVTNAGHILATTHTFIQRAGDGSYQGDLLWLLHVECDTVILRNTRQPEPRR